MWYNGRYDKVFDSHIVNEQDGGTILLYIDRHLVHEVTSPQAFEGLRNAKRKVRRPDCTLATSDHVRIGYQPTLHRAFANLIFSECPHLLPQELQVRRDLHRRGRFPRASRRPREQRTRVRCYILRHRRPATRYRSRHRTGTRFHSARNDHRLR